MSTRGHIIVKDKEEIHYVYNHCDSYISGLGEDLKDCINKYIKSKSSKFTSLDFCEFLDREGYEFEDYGVHGDEEFLYTVEFFDETIKVSVTASKMEKSESGKWVSHWEEVPEYEEIFNIPK